MLWWATRSFPRAWVPSAKTSAMTIEGPIKSRAKKSLGQNFLRDSSVVERIIGALDLRTDETAVEIGPGQGALTTDLLRSAERVIVIEFDRDLIAPLRVQFHNA